MKWATVAGITVWVVLITLYEWPKMNRNQNKEKAAFVILTAMGGLLAVLLLFFPNMAGPTEMVAKFFEPLGKILEQNW